LIVRALILNSCLLHGERKQTGKGDGGRDLLQKMENPLPVFGENTDRGENERKHRKCLLEWLLSKVEETV